MPQSYQNVYERKRKNLAEAAESGEILPSNAEAIRELVDAFDAERITTELPRWPDAQANLTKHREPSTLGSWIYYLKEYAKRVDLLDTTHDELNQVAQDWRTGNDPDKDESLSSGSIRAYQFTLRMFYRYHDVDGVDHDHIMVFEQNDTGVDPRDILTPEEVQEVRDAPTNPRDQAVIDLLLYTGLRNSALRTLRVKDLKPDDGNGKYYYNTDDDGLKHIVQPRAGRPLLGAAPAVRDWLKYHPSGDPDAYFITGKSGHNRTDPSSPVAHKTIQRVTARVKEQVGIDKPLHPHMLRHNFVTICKREYDLDDSTIKFLIGHAPDSSIMETTYQHLSGDDHTKKAEVAAGIREDDSTSSLSPDFCSTCGEPLATEAVACSRCGTTYSPSAKTEKDDIDQAMWEAKSDVTGVDEEMVDAAWELLNDPAELAAVIEEYRKLRDE